MIASNYDEPASAPGGVPGSDTRPDIDIVVSIINYRTADMTLACLISTLEALAGRNGHVAVVDNASGDGSADQIAAWLDARPEAPVTLIRSATNTGFSGGHNQGMGVCDARWYLILNSDALLRPGFFDALLPAAEASGAGLVAPRLEDEDSTPQISCFRFPSPGSEVIRGAETGPVSKLLKRRDVPLGLDPDPAALDWASFACILLDGDMVRQIGPMDEGYFLYFEDIEYALRARRAGWTIRYVPKARAVHFRGGSGPVKARARDRKRLPAYYYASRTRFFRQAHGRFGPLLANLGWYLGRAIAHLRLLTGRRVPPSNKAEARDIWTNIAAPLGDRRAEGGRP